MCKVLVQTSEGGGGLFSVGAAVSTMSDKEDIPDDEKTIFDWCREGNTDKVTLLLRNTDVNIKDENVSIYVILLPVNLYSICSK